MEIQINRIAKKSDYTIGKLYIDGEYFCDSLEDAVREEKIHGKTAIPSGTYKVIMTMSNRFKRLMPLLVNVPNYAGVRIHSGNTAKDTEGCILVGKNTKLGMVTSSRTHTEQLYAFINEAIDNGEQVTLTIN